MELVRSEAKAAMSLVPSPVRTTAYHIAFGIPESYVPIGIRLPFLSVNILSGCDGIFGIRDGPFFIHKVAGLFRKMPVQK